MHARPCSYSSNTFVATLSSGCRGIMIGYLLDTNLNKNKTIQTAITWSLPFTNSNKKALFPEEEQETVDCKNVNT